MAEWLEKLSEEEKDRLIKKSQPSWIKPMLATLTDERFDDEDWIYERKLDGERVLAYKKGKDVKLFSRNRKKVNRNYPELESALKKQGGDFVVDGEVVAFDGQKTSFSKLQPRMTSSGKLSQEAKKIRVYYYVFDIMYSGGYLVDKLTQLSRKKVLKDSLDFSDPLRYTVHRRGAGLKYYRSACSKGWEGVIAKDGRAPYAHSRSRKWLKFKCVKEQEFVVVGYTDPGGSRKGFGALLVGYYASGELRYAGKVGTGYNDELLKDLGGKLKRIEADEKPVKEDVGEKGGHWVKPELVCEVKFTEWTSDGKLRHPAFKGLRRDKKPENVVREDR